MNKLSILIGSVFAGAIAAGTSPAQAATLPPLGYQVMCLQHPDECKAGGASHVVMDDALIAKLRRVNFGVNGSMRPRSDAPGQDVWTVGASAGDCEDYAVTKRQNLIEIGLPPSALRIAYVKTPRGEDHAVLIVKTDRGDLVLDNLTPLIKPLSQTGLRLISVAGANPLSWS